GADQLTGIVDSNAAGPLWSYAYGRDALGQLSSSTDPLEGQQHTYRYNALNQLRADQQAAGTATWALDAADEITQTVNAASAATSTLGYDNANELTSLRTPTQNLT